MKGKKRSTVIIAIRKLMLKANMSLAVAEEVAEIIYDDFEMRMIESPEQLLHEISLIQPLYRIINALCRQFGEVHLEQR